MEKVMLSYRARKWLEILRQCAENGMTKRDYCLEQDINEKTFYYWQRCLRDSLSSSTLSLQEKDARSCPFVRFPIRGGNTQQETVWLLHSSEAVHQSSRFKRIIGKVSPLKVVILALCAECAVSA